MRTLLRACVLALLVLTLVGCDQLVPKYSGIDLDKVNWGRNFRLTDASGRERTMEEFRGKYVMIFFGYVQCPVVCPTVLLRAAETRRALGADGERIQVVFITLDPERDTPALAQEYAEAFDPSFIGLRGDLERTKEVAKEFHVYFKKVPTGGSYAIDHTAITYVLDDKGKLRLGLQHQHSVEQYVADLRALIGAKS